MHQFLFVHPHLAGDLYGNFRNTLRVSFRLLVPIVQGARPAFNSAVICQGKPHIGAFEFLKQRVAVYRNGRLQSKGLEKLKPLLVRLERASVKDFQNAFYLSFRHERHSVIGHNVLAFQAPSDA